MSEGRGDTRRVRKGGRRQGIGRGELRTADSRDSLLLTRSCSLESAVVTHRASHLTLRVKSVGAEIRANKVGWA